MPEQICPVCGCDVGEQMYEREGIVYCCEPCAAGSACECGCCEVVEDAEEEGEGSEGG